MQQQRQLRLGDILDDYCPRERRLANHTVVAMVGDEVRFTLVHRSREAPPALRDRARRAARTAARRPPRAAGGGKPRARAKPGGAKRTAKAKRK